MSALVQQIKIVMSEHYDFYHDETIDNGDIPLSFDEYIREYREDIISIMDQKCGETSMDDPEDEEEEDENEDKYEISQHQRDWMNKHTND